MIQMSVSLRDCAFIQSEEDVDGAGLILIECNEIELVASADWGSEHSRGQIHCTANVQLGNVVWN